MHGIVGQTWAYAYANDAGRLLAPEQCLMPVLCQPGFGIDTGDLLAWSNLVFDQEAYEFQ